MKYILLLLLIASLQGFSQEFNAGIFAGGVASQLDGDTYAGYNKAGITAGGYINRNITKKLLWQFGLRYTQKGSRYANSKLGVYYKAQLHYMDMPLTIRYRYFKKVDFEAGVSLGYLIKGFEQKGNNDIDEANPPFNKFDLASILGLNYHLNDKIDIGTFFSYSILTVRPYTSGNSDFMDDGQHNNIIYFILSYKLSSWH